VKRKRAFIAFATGLASAAVVLAAATFAATPEANPVRLFVDGRELFLSPAPEIRDGTVVAPVRPVAEALGADVRWDGQNRSVHLSTGRDSLSVAREQVIAWISEQGGETDYFWDGLWYEEADLDGDVDLEVVAGIDGAVHLGQFFIFDRAQDGRYKLVKEEGWKVERVRLDDPIEMDGKKLFQIVKRTGGTGLDIYIAHLFYMENGNVVDAWEGILREIQMASEPKNYTLKVGNYQIDPGTRSLYAWESVYRLDETGTRTIGDPATVVKKYRFDGTRFVE